MKKFLIALAATIAVFGLASCKKETVNPIVGTWEATTVEMTIQGMTSEMGIADMGAGLQITFTDNGTASMTGTTGGETMSMDFSYSVEGNTLILDAEGDVAEVPITLEKSHMTWTIDGEMLDQPGATVTIHFKKI